MVFRLELSDFGAFYERTYDTAYRTALGIVRDPALAADITQEAFVAAYRHRHRYRGDAPSTAWLHRIVVNQAGRSLAYGSFDGEGAENRNSAVVIADVTDDGTVADRLTVDVGDGLPPPCPVW